LLHAHPLLGYATIDEAVFSLSSAPRPALVTDQLTRSLIRDTCFLWGPCCSYSDIWSVWFSKIVINTVLKSFTTRRLVKTKDFYMNCCYSDIWSVWFSGSVILACGGDP
jgi:hypothetical protein